MKSDVAKRIESINKGIIPEGYKKTKVGIVPVEWETVKLKTISKHSTEKNKDLKYHETYTNSATQGIIKQTDYFDKQISNNENIDGYYVVKHNDYVYNPRISVSAPCGPIRKSHFSETGVMSPLYTIFRLNDEYEDNEYIEHYFNSPFWHRYMSSVANYGARHDRMNITNDDLFNMPIPFPPLPEQQKIAEILSTQDKLIELQERKINQLKTLKKGYLQKMFPKKGCKYPELRFKGFTDAWEQCKLGKLIENGTIIEQSDGNHGELYPRAEEFTEKGIPYISASSISADGESIDFNSTKYLPMDRAKQFRKGVTKNGDILLAHNATVGPAVLLSMNYEFAILSTSMTLYRLDDKKMNSYYFLQAIRSRFFQIQLETFMAQTTRNQVPILTQRNLLISYPTNINEQEKIGKFLLSFDKQLALHQRKLDEEKLKKKALMQLLLTGKVRVK